MGHTERTKPPWATMILCGRFTTQKDMQTLLSTHIHHLLTKIHSEKCDLELFLLSCKHYTVGLYKGMNYYLLGYVAKTWSYV